MVDFMNSTYVTLQDDDMVGGGGQTHVLAKGVVLTKFCVFGLVSSKSWDLTYIVVSVETISVYISICLYVCLYVCLCVACIWTMF
jgi:hypothetical protein